MLQIRANQIEANRKPAVQINSVTSAHKDKKPSRPHHHTLINPKVR
jgi:hypothetical protein